VRWKLAVTNAEDVLYVCRLAPCLNEYDIARKLVQQGMRFRTLLPLKEIPRSPIVTNHILPIRLPGYKFTPKDYKAYQQQCQVIFSQTRARAAMLRGGIVWRLVLDILSFDDALRGPSLATTVHRQGLSVTDPQTGDRLCDDDLTQGELDLLCGAYICYTGMFQNLYCRLQALDGIMQVAVTRRH
jgi:hypothetical protein